MVSTTPTCDLCRRRNVIEYRVEPEEAWKVVVLNRWRNPLPELLRRRGRESGCALQLHWPRGAVVVGPAAAKEPAQAETLDGLSVRP